MPKHPELIIHCAARTDVGECEEMRDLTYLINSLGTFNLAQVCRRLVYISTDHVFDGTKGNYTENDIPNPQGIYAKSKLVGEWFTLWSPDNLVIRTSFMKDFTFDKAFTNKYWSGMWLEDAAKEIAQAIKMNLTGLYHIAGSRKSIYDFVKERYPNIGKIVLQDNPNGKGGLPYLKDTSLDSVKWENAKKSHKRRDKL